ncbi:uncharacterized protein LOC134096154 isoform X1 [Sardina pilchardus]|uniref:uncharacterized protein LOC134096154 isoform X1 n=1 Tax=Sardina pilchardus TaxID=27697 RepID=UPI002E0E8505
MAQNHVMLNSQDFPCPICLELLKDPVTIPCGHNYCQGCIWECWVRNDGSETVSCPTCRESFTPMPILRKNILLAETVDRLRRTHCSTSPAIAASVSAASNYRPHRGSAYTTMNVQQQPATASRATNVRHQGASASTATNVQQQHASTFTATNVQQQRASVFTATNVRQERAVASTPTNVRQQRTSASRATNVGQQRASASTATNVRQQHAAASRTTNVGQQRASASTATNVRQQRAAASTATNVRQQRAAASTATNVGQQRASASRATNVGQQRTSTSTATNVGQQRASAFTATNVRQQGASASTATNVQQQQRASAFTAMNVLWPRVLAMLLACVAFSVALDGGMVEDQSVGTWCLFSWEFCFIGTLLVLLMDLCKLPSCVPVFWENFSITFACFASLFCLTASITFALHFVKGFFMHGVSYNYRVVSLVFSCFATIAYLMEVNISKARSDTNRDRPTAYMTTEPGLLKVYETFVAGIIFVFINDPNAYESHAAIKWCMAVYCVCFIMSSMVIILSVGNCSDCFTFPISCFPSFNTLLAVIMYLTATIIWPIYKFDTLHGGSPSRPSECSSSSNPDLCPFDKLIVVAVLTSVNFILYLADLIYSVIQLEEVDENPYSQF